MRPIPARNLRITEKGYLNYLLRGTLPTQRRAAIHSEFLASARIFLELRVAVAAVPTERGHTMRAAPVNAVEGLHGILDASTVRRGGQSACGTAGATLSSYFLQLVRHM